MPPSLLFLGIKSNCKHICESCHSVTRKNTGLHHPLFNPYKSCIADKRRGATIIAYMKATDYKDFLFLLKTICKGKVRINSPAGTFPTITNSQAGVTVMER